MIRLFLLLIAIIFLIVSCDDDIVTPPPISYGITGRILDESGNILTGAKIYYMFNYNYFPNNKINIVPSIPSKIDSFGYSLNQNLPNPVYNSVFVRYSIATNLNVELTIQERSTGKTRVIYSAFNDYGYYQQYFNNLVDSFQLENGCYFLTFKAVKNGMIIFQETKKLFVLSDLGSPSCISNNNGVYLFDYSKACIGDTIYYTGDGNLIYPQQINNSLNFLIKKDGFVTEIVSTNLYPSILINQDIILKEEEK